MNIVSILECVTLMDFGVCVVEGVRFDMEGYQVFVCVAWFLLPALCIDFVRIWFLTWFEAKATED